MRCLPATRGILILTVAAVAAFPVTSASRGQVFNAVLDSEVWTFDRIDRLGSHPTRVLGNPRLIDSPIGKAIEFDGIDDAIFVDIHPLAGAQTFTWEAIFRPDGGNTEQRWFHLQETNTEDRMLFEIRVVDNDWYLDSYLHGPAAQKALIDRNKRHPLGTWYHVASIYDGREFRNYVNGILQGAAEMPFTAQGLGRSSIGVRINLVNYFKGAIHLARFTRRALAPVEFVKMQSASAGPRLLPFFTAWLFGATC